jgi:hypothetical protein
MIESDAAGSEEFERTEGMGMLPLKRLRTRLSIPLGLRHDSGTHLKRSDWWRKKRLVPVHSHVSPLIFHVLVCMKLQDSSNSLQERYRLYR